MRTIMFFVNIRNLFNLTISATYFTKYFNSIRIFSFRRCTSHFFYSRNLGIKNTFVLYYMHFKQKCISIYFLDQYNTYNTKWHTQCSLERGSISGPEVQLIVCDLQHSSGGSTIGAEVGYISSQFLYLLSIE